MKRPSEDGDAAAMLAKRPREFSESALAAEVAAAKASTDQMMKSMGLKVDTQTMSFTKLALDGQQTKNVPVGKRLVEHLMTPEHRQILTEETGAEVEWSPEESKVKLQGSPEQLKRATRLLARVEMHCHWGSSEAKVRRLLRRQQVQSVLCRLSPMSVDKLFPAEKMFSGKECKMSVGKDKSNDVCIQDPVVSRNHCLLSFDEHKGAVYVTDLSTNGTYLNGSRLPSKKLGKVLLSHGDELLLKDPKTGDMEFGFICNLKEVRVQEERRLEAPRRLLSPDETSMTKSLGEGR